MKKILLSFLAFFVLMGLINCTLIEPAFAYNDEAAHSEESGEDSDCCFTHCSACHQWTTSSRLTVIHNVKPLDFIIPEINFSDPDSVVGTIFHPPIAH